MVDGNTQRLEAWGRKLLNDFPAGLGSMPDFEHDGQARLLWFSHGYSVGVQWASEIGAGGKVFLGKLYEDPDALDNTGKIEFATRAFDLGRLYVNMAKSEADKKAKQDQLQQIAIKAADKDAEALHREVATVSSREALHIRIDAAKRDSIAAREAGNAIEDYSISRKITVLQSRLIEIEAKESRRSLSSWWITAIGTVAGIIGLVLGFLAGSGCS